MNLYQSIQAARKALFWLIVLAALIGGLYLFSSILTPFVAGAVVAYFFDPIIVFLERHQVKRIYSTSLILALFVCLFAVAVIAFVPPMIRDFADLITNAPSYVDKFQKLAIGTGAPLLAKLGIEIDFSSITNATDAFIGQGSNWLLTVLQSVLTGGQVIMSTASLLIISPIVAFYLLADWPHLLTTL